MNHSVIACEKHDYIEIACLYGYRVKLTFADNACLEGKAITTVTSADKREYLIINDGNEDHKIELNQLSKLQVLTKNAAFKGLIF